ncbi:ATP-binding cassette domain-containing protein [Klebsiella pneumoniae]|nr:ATP-binding cassette domain-containing protein [Klebsiella pneumoniae]
MSVRRQPLLREVNSSRSPAGEIVTLMGPSGSGKRTLFAWMVGALSADLRSTRRAVAERSSLRFSLPVEQRRGIGILFQDAPLPFDAFQRGAKFTRCWRCQRTCVGRARRNTAVEQAPRDSPGWQTTSPRAIRPHSFGGERARVSLLRALLARQPQALLLDEPFSRLDANAARLIPARGYSRFWPAQAIPVVLVTHDREGRYFPPTAAMPGD